MVSSDQPLQPYKSIRLFVLKVLFMFIDLRQMAKSSQVLMIALAMAGCNGGNEGTDESAPSLSSPIASTPAVEQQDIKANDAYISLPLKTASTKVQAKSEVATTYTFDMAPYISGLSKAAGQVNIEMSPSNEASAPQCAVTRVDNTRFAIDTAQAVVCDYNYHLTLMEPVEGGVGIMSKITQSKAPTKAPTLSVDAAEATTRVVIQSASDSTPFEYVIDDAMVGEHHDVELSQLLTIPTGYTLDASSTSISYGTASNVVTLPSANQISFIPDAEGIVRVLFAYKKDTDTSVIKTGIVDVMVLAGNGGSDHFGLVQNIIIGDSVDVGERIDIDVSQYVNAGYTASDYALTYVNTFNASVTKKGETDPDNKVIVFQADNAGVYHVAFVITNAVGEYRVGHIELSVSDPNDITPWKFVHEDSHFFSPPLLVSEALEQNIGYSGQYVEIGTREDGSLYNVDTIFITPLEAKAMCQKRGGRLPTPEQFSNELRNVGNNDSDWWNWPQGSRYVTVWMEPDPVTPGLYLERFTTVDIFTNEQTTLPDDALNSGYYASCLFEAAVISTDETLPVSMTAPFTVEVVVRDATNGALKVGEVVTLEGFDSSKLTITTNPVTTDNDGKATFEVTALVPFVDESLQVSNSTAELVLSATGNRNSAEVTEGQIVTDDQDADGISQNKVSFSLIDTDSYYGVKGEYLKVIVEADSDNDAVSLSGLDDIEYLNGLWGPTNDNGIINLAITSTEPQDVILKALYPRNNQDIISKEITFTDTHVFPSYTADGRTQTMYGPTSLLGPITEADMRYFARMAPVAFANVPSYSYVDAVDPGTQKNVRLVAQTKSENGSICEWLATQAYNEIHGSLYAAGRVDLWNVNFAALSGPIQMDTISHWPESLYHMTNASAYVVHELGGSIRNPNERVMNDVEARPPVCGVLPMPF